MASGTSSKILKTVPREKAFYFFTSIGNYTGVSAASLKEFVEKINQVNVKSLEFHLCHGDFEKWIAEVLEDQWLAEDVKKLQKLGFTGDSLRNQLYLTASRRMKRLMNLPNPVRF
jgi:hypothetical protein